MNLFVKKLIQKPIGTHVEVTIENGASLEKVTGVITDNDYTTSVEITTVEGYERLIDYSTIKGFLETKKLDAVLKELTEGTKVKFSYGDASEKEPNLIGTVGENDGEESVEIVSAGGEDLILNYSIVRSLVVISNCKPVHKPVPPALEPEPPQSQPIPIPKPKKVPLYQQEPEDILNAGDSKLKETFDRLPRDDRKKLNSVFDSFNYGIKVNDRDKMLAAAKQARMILFKEDDQGYYWSEDAVSLVGYLLRRVNIYDCEVFLVGECFEEAAYAAWHDSKHHLAGAYAITALMEHTDYIQDMVIIIANSVVKANDISGISVFYEHFPQKIEVHLNAIISGAFAAKGIQLSADQNIPDALNMLKTLYPNDTMGNEVAAWLPKEEISENKTASKDKQPDPPKSAEPEFAYGTISKISWSDHTGIITDDDGVTYTFRYKDITDALLAKEIQACLRGDLDGKVYTVKFFIEKQTAKNIMTDTTLVDRARVIASDATRSDRYEIAFNLCKRRHLALPTFVVRWVIWLDMQSICTKLHIPMLTRRRRLASLRSTAVCMQTTRRLS